MTCRPTADAEGSVLWGMLAEKQILRLRGRFREMLAGIKCRMEDRSMASRAAAPLREMKWSPAEKVVARRAFDLALGRELEAVVEEAKDRAAKIQEPSELWELERWLTERRQGIDRKYDYRYSVLPLVLEAVRRAALP